MGAAVQGGRGDAVQSVGGGNAALPRLQTDPQAALLALRQAHLGLLGVKAVGPKSKGQLPALRADGGRRLPPVLPGRQGCKCDRGRPCCLAAAGSPCDKLVHFQGWWARLLKDLFKA